MNKKEFSLVRMLSRVGVAVVLFAVPYEARSKKIDMEQHNSVAVIDEAEIQDKSSEKPVVRLAEANTDSGKQVVHKVKTLGVKFTPMLLYINPGDRVDFENMEIHNLETLGAMVPKGQKKINSEIGENVSITFKTVGIIVYKCTPHWGNRMGGVIVVGKPDNIEAIIDEYMKSTEVDKTTLPAVGLLKKLKKDLKAKGLI